MSEDVGAGYCCIIDSTAAVSLAVESIGEKGVLMAGWCGRRSLVSTGKILVVSL